MQLFLQQLTNGIALGSVYALMAIGFTLIFGVLRLLNMSHGELYMLGAYLAYTTLAMLGWPAWIGVPLAVAMIFALSLGIERVAFKPLRAAPHFIPLVSTIAVSTIVLESVRLVYGPYMFGFDSFIPRMSWTVGGLRIDTLQAFMLALSIGLMAGVQIFLRRLQWGKAVRAVAQDLTMSGLLGINANRVIGLTFAIGSALGAVAGVLIAMYFGAVYPDMGFVALVKAFTAAILGGMGSVSGAVLGGFLLGIAESLGATYLPSGFSDALPLAMLFVVLLFLPSGLTGRGKGVDAGGHHSIMQLSEGVIERLINGRVRFGLALPGKLATSTWLGVVGGVAVLAAAPFLGDYALRVLFTIAVYAMMALGTSLVLGLSGQLSLCHAAFFAIGAYSSAILSTEHGLGFWSAMPVGVLLSCIAGFLLSLVTFRVRGYYLALVTLAFAELVRITISHWNEFTGGMMGIRAIPPIAIGSWELVSPLALFYVGAGFLAGALILYAAIAYSAKGRALIALRDDEIAARSCGLDTQRLKIAAFTLSAVFPSIGGSIMAHYYSAITPDLGSVHETITVLVITVVGGLASAAGAVFGSTVVNLLPELFREFGDYRLLVYGVMLFAVILYQPQGAFSIGRTLAARA